MDYKIFGCKVNKYYTDLWLNSSYLRDKSGVFIATCVVTDRAKRKWIKFIRDEVHKLKGNDMLYISGCAVLDKGTLKDNFFELYPELIDFRDKIELLEEKPKEKIDFIRERNIYTKKFLLIQGGCDSHCTFCLTVSKRGNHFSQAREEILKEITDYERTGGKEIVLTGVNLGAWGAPSTNDVKDSKFNDLLVYILSHSSIPRIRISSLGPEFVNDKTLEIFRDTRIYPHFHYSVQSGSEKILKSMNRHYNRDYLLDLLTKTKNLKRDDGVEVSIGADLIVGFPTETKEDFMETYKLVENGLITKVHVFPFSSHTIGEKVPASFYEGQINEKIKKDRVREIESIGDRVRKEFIERNIGKNLQVLVEYAVKDGDIIRWKGWTQNYIEACEKNFIIQMGEIKKNNIIIGQLKQ